jgi:adenylate cyclase class 2
MGVEIEKKYRLKKGQPEEVIARLKELGATFTVGGFEENYLHKGNLLDEKKAFLRVRKFNGKAVLTYKEKLSSEDNVKYKIEHETEVGDVEAMESIIESLGYKLSVIYEKRRQTWHLPHVVVTVDELPFGDYMEIEGDEEHIIEAEKLLDIGGLEPEPRGYPRLTQKFGETIDDIAVSRFSAAQTP